MLRDRTRVAALSVNEIDIPFQPSSVGGAPTGGHRILDSQQLAELLDGHLELGAQRLDVELARRVDGAPFEPIGYDTRRRDRMRTAERLKTRRRDDVFDNLQLETYPDVQRAVLGFARHETRHTGRQFPRPHGRCEVPLDGWTVFHRRVNSLAEKRQAEHHAGADFASARNSREHNGANVLTLGGKRISNAQMREIVRVWLSTDMTEERHRRRVATIDALLG